MNASDLLAEWEEGGSGLRPARAQVLRADLMEHTGIWLPHRRSELESFLDRFKPHITRKLRERVAEEGHLTVNPIED